MTRTIADTTFLVLANGHPDSPPAGPLVEFLNAARARRVHAIHHPLTPEESGRHRIATWERGEQVALRTARLPSRPPLTYPLDLLVPPILPRADVCVAYNSLAAARALAERAIGRTGQVLYWAVDFVPDRFGRGPLTRIYDALDRLACMRADARFDLSRAALEGRAERHGIRPGMGAPAHVAPIGAWLDRVPTVGEDAWEARRVVFLGHLVPRQGVAVLVDALRQLAQRGVEFDAEIAGRGPDEDALRRQAADAGLDGRLRFLGFLSDHTEVERFLAAGSVAVAPYDTRGDSFTRYADPSKLKSYLAAGLPILTTDVPPNAHELAEHGGAEVVPFDSGAIADALERVLSSREEWRRRRADALRYRRDFDWSAILSDALRFAGIEP